SQIEDLQSLSRQYEQQAAERMTSAAYYTSSSMPGENGESQREEMYINMPVIVQGRRR
ncbi:hypothetical protein MMC14_007275, partial [Varicellaria rhodocarpa]|nr:hypothetical protein [Varicellaria rhodocarpa]